MTKLRTARAAVAVAAGVSLVGGVGYAMSGDTSGTIDTTGPDSHNSIKFDTKNKADVTNNNSVAVGNANDQHAYSGDAKVKENTTGGDAKTGATSNDNSFSADLSVDNSGSGCGCLFGGSGGGDPSGSISNTGPKSKNDVTVTTSNKLNLTNNNSITVQNTNTQKASSGDASVEYNTTGGDAVSGAASNSNSSSVTISVTN